MLNRETFSNFKDVAIIIIVAAVGVYAIYYLTVQTQAPASAENIIAQQLSPGGKFIATHFLRARAPDIYTGVALYPADTKFFNPKKVNLNDEDALVLLIRQRLPIRMTWSGDAELTIQVTPPSDGRPTAYLEKKKTYRNVQVHVTETTRTAATTTAPLRPNRPGRR